jgi:hypothetical protein
VTDVTFQAAALATPPSGTKVLTETTSGAEEKQGVQLTIPGTGAAAYVPASAANGLLADVSRVQGVVHVDDNAASLTVDAPVGTPVWVRLSDGAAAYVGQKTMANSLPVTIASDQSNVPANVAQIGGVAPVVDNAAFTDGTTPVVASGFIFDEVAGTALTENDAGAARMDSKRAQVGVLEDATTRGQRAAVSAAGRLSVDASGVAVPITDNAGSLTVDAPVGTPVFVRLSDGTAALVGQKVMASSLPVVIASDQSALDVSDRAARLVGHVDGTVASGAADAGNPAKIGGKATFPAIPTLVATGQRVDGWADLAGAIVTRKRPVATYTAVYRLADATAGLRALSKTMTANTDAQFATIYHAATATKRVQIKYVSVMFWDNAGLGASVEFEIQPLSATTAPATGNPAITPGKNDQADAAAESTCLALPTTAGSLVAVNAPVGDSYGAVYGIAGTGSTLEPPPISPRIVLWDSRADGDGKDLIMRAAIAEGFAVIARANAASTLRLTVTIIFTEE